MIKQSSQAQLSTYALLIFSLCYRAFILNQMNKFKIGQKVETNIEIQPESEYWEKGYWKIPKGHKSIITDIDEDGNCLIEYIEATFYVDSSFLNARQQNI